MDDPFVRLTTEVEAESSNWVPVRERQKEENIVALFGHCVPHVVRLDRLFAVPLKTIEIPVAEGPNLDRKLEVESHMASIAPAQSRGERAGMSPERSTMNSEMPGRIVRDYRSMTDQELRATAHEARRREETARYAKGRRSWKAVWSAAEEELASRRTSARN